MTEKYPKMLFMKEGTRKEWCPHDLDGRDMAGNDWDEEGEATPENLRAMAQKAMQDFRDFTGSAP